MELNLTRMNRRSSALLNTVFNMVMKIDYKALSRYIISLNQKQDLENILIEASKCLKHILNYRLFAFAVLNDDVLDVWVDPSIYREPFAKVIREDFDVKGELNIRPISDSMDSNHTPRDIRSSDMVSYVVKDGPITLKLYVIPERKMYRYHDDILTIIINTLGVAVSNFIKIKRLEGEATIDILTQCYNRRELDRLIDHHIANAQRYEKDLSVIMFDLDYFKLINDVHGHQAGDQILKHIAETIRNNIRKGDCLARYGGEEFLIVLPNTGISKALEMAERIRSAVEQMQTRLSNGCIVRVTASFGVASLKENSGKEVLLATVDRMLYKAKHNGRNTIVSEIDTP